MKAIKTNPKEQLDAATVERTSNRCKFEVKNKSTCMSEWEVAILGKYLHDIEDDRINYNRMVNQ